MTRGLIVRPALVADIPTMHAVRLSVRENRLSDRSRIGERDYIPFVDDKSAWVAESGGIVIGFAAIDRAAARVWALFVDPAAEGLGAGRLLHERLLAFARDEQLLPLVLTTGPGTRAENFYRNNGWTEVGREGDGEITFELAV